jgi:16S rRNA (uracil1498-N3)-methyltransferase
MPPRVFVPSTLGAIAALELPADAVRHVQVLRLQPGDALTLFDGRGGEWGASVLRIGRREVEVAVLEHRSREVELPIAVTLAVAMPAGDRMDALVDKATELGAAAIQPLLTERSVLRLDGERAERRRLHWQAIAVAACEQCGRNRVPAIHAVQTLAAWLAPLPAPAVTQSRWLLGWRKAMPWSQALVAVGASATLLSGPEGGFTDLEEDIAHARGFVTVSLGARVLRADTAPLAALAAIALGSG